MNAPQPDADPPFARHPSELPFGRRGFLSTGFAGLAAAALLHRDGVARAGDAILSPGTDSAGAGSHPAASGLSILGQPHFPPKASRY